MKQGEEIMPIDKEEVQRLMARYEAYMEVYLNEAAENKASHDELLRNVDRQRAYYEEVDRYCEKHAMQIEDRSFVRSLLADAYKRNWKEERLLAGLAARSL